MEILHKLWNSGQEAFSSVLNTFRGPPLGPRTIRLLRLLPGSKDDKIQCQLFEYEFRQKAQWHYDALSYVWGDQRQTKRIVVDGWHVNVTVNLHAALTRLRDQENERVMWIDALCINQADLKERASQVQLMPMIYAFANQVVAWLGEEERDSDFAFSAIQAAASIPEIMDLKAVLKEMSAVGTDLTAAVERLIKRPYFTRVWVCITPYPFA